MTHKEGNKPFVSLHSVLGKPFILDQYVIPVVLKVAPQGTLMHHECPRDVPAKHTFDSGCLQQN